MELVLTKPINNITVDGYYADNEAWFTRYQIGSALEYADPQNAITIIHRKHKERLDPLSRWCQFDTPSGRQEGFMYSFEGVLEICRWSRQPKADKVMDSLYAMAKEVLTKGYFSIISDDQLIELIQERKRLNPYYFKQLSQAEREREKQIKFDNRETGIEQTRELWVRFFTNHEEINVPKELRKIWVGDMPMYHKYLDQFHVDERKARKGLIITI